MLYQGAKTRDPSEKQSQSTHNLRGCFTEAAAEPGDIPQAQRKSFLKKKLSIEGSSPALSQ